MIMLIARRLAIGIITLWVVSLLIFAGTEILPGDVASAILGQSRTPETEAALRAELGLDRAAPVRYAEWLLRFAQGDIGKSLANRRDISPEIRVRLSNTVFLAAVAAAIAVPLAIGLGLLGAIWPNGVINALINPAALVLTSVPEFFTGYFLVKLLAVNLGWFPSLSMVSDSMSLGERLYAIALPAAVLVIAVVAHMMRLTRAALQAVLASPFVEMLILKGVPKWRIVVTHALPNALAPIANVVAINLAYLIVGVVVVEVVFVYPGMGQLMVDAVSKRDVPVVQTCGLIFACAYVGLNLAADLIAIVANPRLRYPR